MLFNKEKGWGLEVGLCEHSLWMRPCKIYSKVYCTLSATTHHDVATFEYDKIV